MNIETQLEHDFDMFENSLSTSPKDELNKPRKCWDDGNVLHGLMSLTNENIETAPQLMSCEYDHWLYLIYKAKGVGVDICYKNNNNQTPLEYLYNVNKNKELSDAVKTILEGNIKIEFN